jgi:hypothetical protein
MTFLVKNWKLVGWGVSVAIMSVQLVIAWGDSAHWEKLAVNRQLLIEKAKREAAEQRAKIAERYATALDGHTERVTAMEPVIVHSRDTVREYAQTPAGRTTCLPAERVQLLERDDRALEAASRAGSGESAVPDPADPPAK